MKKISRKCLQKTVFEVFQKVDKPMISIVAKGSKVLEHSILEGLIAG